jgi:hypothetical protein
MTSHDYLKDLKRITKDCARASGAELHEVQKRAAQAIGFAHWHALASKAKLGWQPTAEDIARVEGILRGDENYPDEGFIGQHPYQLDDVLRCIFIGEAPSSKPQLLITDRRFKNNPIQDPDFVAKALPIAQWKARQVRAEIARDWPRNSTKPDADGRAMHPLNHERSDKWYCLHCDGESSGAQMAQNLWHCPYCGATPLDMFSEPFPTSERPETENDPA